MTTVDPRRALLLNSVDIPPGANVADLGRDPYGYQVELGLPLGTNADQIRPDSRWSPVGREVRGIGLAEPEDYVTPDPNKVGSWCRLWVYFTWLTEQESAGGLSSVGRLGIDCGSPDKS